MQQYIVLVADADPVNLEVLEFHLARLDFEVEVARDGLQAIDLAVAVNPDLMLIDVGLPDVDGFEVCKALKSNHLFAEIPIVLMSAESDPEVLLKGLQLGAADYLIRPFVPEDLEQRVLMHLARSRENVTVMGYSLQQGLAYAAGARRRMLGIKPAQAGPVRLSAAAQRSTELGGDAPGFWPLGDDHAGMFLLSVEGNGIAPTLLTASLHALLSPEPGRGLLLDRGGQPREPGELLRILDEAFPEEKTGHALRLAYVLVDGRDGSFRYAERGMPACLRLTAGGEVEPLWEVPGRDGFREGGGTLGPGETLVLPGRAWLTTSSSGPGLDLAAFRAAAQQAHRGARRDHADAVAKGVLLALHRQLMGKPPAMDVATTAVSVEPS